MLALRTAHERAKRDPTFIEPDPRPAMVQLADDYPGALREIDVLPLDLIAARIAALKLAERGAEPAEPWMNAQVLFHRFARAVLATKRWLGARREITPTLRSEFTIAAVRLGVDTLVVADELEAIATPPRGRLMDLVYAKVARALMIEDAEARTLVFERRRAPAANGDAM